MQGKTFMCHRSYMKNKGIFVSTLSIKFTFSIIEACASNKHGQENCEILGKLQIPICSMDRRQFEIEVCKLYEASGPSALRIDCIVVGLD